MGDAGDTRCHRCGPGFESPTKHPAETTPFAPDVEAVRFSGGTGVAPRDVTPENVEPLPERAVPGFGELFRMLSCQEIGSAAVLSRALAGIAGSKLGYG